jgi:hypothetical protein
MTCWPISGLAMSSFAQGSCHATLARLCDDRVVSLPFTCAACRRPFLAVDGGKCRVCGGLFCRPHLKEKWSKDGPICRVCTGASDHRHPMKRVLDRLFGR